MALDTLVMETVGRLAEGGRELSPVAVKAAVQVARTVVQLREDLRGPSLIGEVVIQLRHRRVLLTPDLVERVLGTYARLVLELDIQEINEFG